jgi:hypothetical protein
MLTNCFHLKDLETALRRSFALIIRSNQLKVRMAAFIRGCKSTRCLLILNLVNREPRDT